MPIYFPLGQTPQEEPVMQGIGDFDLSPPLLKGYEVYDDKNLITFFFSKPVKADLGAFEIKNGDTPMEFTQNTLGKKIIVAMKQEMSPGQTYSIKFDPSKVSDFYGSVVKADAFEKSFTALNISMRKGFESNKAEQQFEINQGSPDDLITSINAQKIVNGKPDGTVIQGGFYNIGGGIFRFTPETELGVGDYQVTVTSKVPYSTNPNQTRNFSFIVSPRYWLSTYKSYTEGVACLKEGAIDCGGVFSAAEMTCDSQQVLTKIVLRTGSVVDEISQIGCRPINQLGTGEDNSEITYKDFFVGGKGGAVHHIGSSEPGRVISKIVGNFTFINGYSKVIQWMNVGVATLGDQGNFTNQYTQVDGEDKTEISCEDGWVLVGLKATIDNSAFQYVGGYQGICRKLNW